MVPPQLISMRMHYLRLGPPRSTELVRHIRILQDVVRPLKAVH